MPSELHKIISKMFQGTDSEKYEWVDSLMDSTAQVHGPKHRNDFVHSPIFIYFISNGDPKAVQRAYAHLLTDYGFTWKQDRQVEAAVAAVKLLEDGLKPRRRRKRTSVWFSSGASSRHTP